MKQNVKILIESANVDNKPVLINRVVDIAKLETIRREIKSQYKAKIVLLVYTQLLSA